MSILPEDEPGEESASAYPKGIFHSVRSYPGANTQGATLDEARENLREAVQLVLEANGELAERSLVGQNVSKEPFSLQS